MTALSLVGILLLLAALPLVLELLVLSLAALAPPRAPRLSPAPFALAAVVPAHNEETLVAACVQSLLQADSSLAVYVVAHNCTDRTASNAEAAGANVLPLHGPSGKGLALDHGFTHALAAGAEGVLVVDADSLVSPNLPATVRARLAAGAPALQCRYQVANADQTTRTALAALAFLGMNVLRPRGRDRLGLSSGIFGNAFALSAGTLRAVPYTSNSLVEDLEYHLHLLRAGLRVHFVDESTVFAEMPVGSAAAASQRARWEGGRLLMRRTWSVPLVRNVLGGKLRMLEPLLDLLAFPLSTEASLLLAALLLGLVAGLSWLTLAAAFGLAILLFYVVGSATLGPDPAGSLRALAAAPRFLLWKLSLIPRTRLSSSRSAAWVRTARNADSEPTEPRA